MAIDPQRIAQRIVDTLAQAQGGAPVGSNESVLLNERVVRDRHFKKKTPDIGGKIKYLYSVAAETGRDLYVGGHKGKPIRVGAEIASERFINFTNLGQNNWLIDLLSLVDATSSRFISRTRSSDRYISRLLTGLDDRIARRSLSPLYGLKHSFVARSEDPEAGSLTSKYLKAFQGNVEVGDAGLTPFFTFYVLPNLSYVHQQGGGLALWLPFAINQAGTAGVGIYNESPSPKVAWFDTSIHTTSVPTQFTFNANRVDCFDDRYSVFTLQTPTVAGSAVKAKVKVPLSLYSPEAIALSSQEIEVYAIPLNHRSSAIVLSASYHP